MKYHAIYRLNFYDDNAVEELRRSEAQYITPERIEAMLNHAFKKGQEQGVVEGRIALRNDIESGAFVTTRDYDGTVRLVSV